MTTNTSGFFENYTVLTLLPWKKEFRKYSGHNSCLFLIQPYFALIPIHVSLSHVPEEVDLSSSSKGLLNGLRVAPFLPPLFGSGIGMKPNFAQWTKKSSGGFLRHVSFFSNAELLEEMVFPCHHPQILSFLDVLPGTTMAVFLVSQRMTIEEAPRRWPRYGKNQDLWN